MVKFRSHLVKLDIHKEALLVERETFKMNLKNNRKCITKLKSEKGTSSPS
jgi:hypothetical protein